MNAKLSLGLLLLTLLAGCKRPQPPPTDKPPEPQASAMRDAIQQPLDKAHALQRDLDQAAARQGAAVDAATQ
ncbi:MAG TPA: hypothetical protein DDZ67_14480 [Xanthomonadaceae bacterium]|nr:hypothetical protein [Xanthomonadaceae bacterium]